MTTPPTLRPEEVTKLLAALAADTITEVKQAAARRNQVICLLMVDAGLRSNEARQLRVGDLYWGAEPRRSIQVQARIAKRRESRTIPASPRLREALAAHWPDLTHGANIDPNEFAFPSRSGPGTITTRQIRRIITTAAERALGKQVTTRWLRHTFGDGLREVTDIRTVQVLMGHRDIRSTMIYTHPRNEELAEAIAAKARQDEEPGK